MASQPAAARNGPKGSGALRPRRPADDQGDADQCAARRRAQHDGQQHAPAQPRPERGQQLEIAVAHAVLPCQQPEQVIYGPETQVPHRSTNDGIGRADRQARARKLYPAEGRQQSAPQQRQCEGVGQQLVIEVDDRQGDQEPGDHHGAGGGPARPELPGHGGAQAGAQQFYQRIAQADARAAVCTAPAEQQPAQHRDVLPGLDRCTAARAGRARHDQVVGFVRGRCSGRRSRRRARQRRSGGRRIQFRALCPPLPVQHDRQAMDDDIEKAADHQPKGNGQHHPGRRRELCQAGHGDQTTAPSLKIGRYMAMTRPPTSTPRMAMISGSSRLDMLSTALSTSSS